MAERRDARQIGSDVIEQEHQLATILYNGDEPLSDHQGVLTFLDSATGRWSSSWGYEALGEPGHDPLRVRATCACGGWVGPELPWSADEDYPSQDQETALIALWYVDHARPLRDQLGGAR